MHLFQLILKITLGRWACLFLFPCFSEETEAQTRLVVCLMPHAQYVVGLGTEMPAPFLLCHVAFLPGGTSGCEAGEQEKAEVPPLRNMAVNFQLKITLGASCALT